jgi:hypothetical protein
LRRRQRNTEIAGLRHRHAGVAAGVDRRKRRQVHVDVEADAVIAAVLAHAQTKRRDLGRADIDPRRAAMPLGGHALLGKQVDHRLLDRRHQLAHLQPPPAEVEEQVDHHLTGTVVGDLPTPIGLQQRDAEVGQQVLRLAGLTEGEHRRCSQHHSSSPSPASRAAVNRPSPARSAGSRCSPR